MSDENQWVRDALKAQQADIHGIRAELSSIHRELQDFIKCAMSSIPDGNPAKHLTVHQRWELQELEQKKKCEEDAKLRLEVRNGLVKTGINVLLVFLGGVFLLGVQAQFGIWVEKAQAPKVTVESTAKVVK